jgi:hypothetical protein
MPVFFNALNLSDPSSEYVAWVDVMGIQNAMKTSIKITANFVYKLHIAVLQSIQKTVSAYPVMDGIYLTSPDVNALCSVLGGVFNEISNCFKTDSGKPGFQFIIKAGMAQGEVYHGRDLKPEASTVLEKNRSHRDSILLGMPIVLALQAEKNAPPFGVALDSTLTAPNTITSPYGNWWPWFNNKFDKRAFSGLLDQYYDYFASHWQTSNYPTERMVIHRDMAKRYFA